jgi:hypothetical protein
MLIGPDEIVQRIQHQHRPGWLVWYGRATKQYWALASWVHASHAMIGAASPDAIAAAMVTFEMLHPKHGQQRSRAVGHIDEWGRTS